MWMVESSIPIAMMLLSWGWNAKNVDAGGGGMNVVITCMEDAWSNLLEVWKMHPNKIVKHYLKCHHVKQWNLATTSRHHIRIILGECNAWNCLLWIGICCIICHDKTAIWLPMVWHNTGCGLLSRMDKNYTTNLINLKITNRKQYVPFHLDFAHSDSISITFEWH